MNVTELARRINVSPEEMRDLLPRLGFDIGRRAIKVDDRVARKIIESVRKNSAIIEEYRKANRPEEEVKPADIPASERQKVVVPETITVRDFASLIQRPVATVIQELMKNGILANLNEHIDYETATIIAQDLGFTTVPQEATTPAPTAVLDEQTPAEQLNLQPRPPIIVVMGHVDHGKTQLLDKIRRTNVVAQESGGITQHIGAYQARHENQLITFIDTPGHQAFTSMRSRGARVADIAILVIAADDGIKPQTEEAIQIIQSAKLTMIVAINKIDKPEANADKVLQQLAQKNLLPESWGGSIITVPLSAKTGEGVPKLLEQIILVAEVEKDKIRASSDGPARGTIIESHVSPGEGPVATVIIRSGTLRRGDMVKAGRVVGKVRAIKDFTNQEMQTAGPSTPAKILGLGAAPEVGDVLEAAMDTGQSLKKIKKQIQHEHKLYRDRQAWRNKQTTKKSDEKKTLTIILKTDTVGSQEALIQSLETITAPNVSVTIGRKGLGDISDVDVLHAEGTGGLVYGFNVKLAPQVEEQARDRGVVIKRYSIVYDLLDDVTKRVSDLVSYVKERVDVGRAKVLAVFRTERRGMIIGTLITTGKAIPGLRADVKRGKETVAAATVKTVQQGKQSVPEVAAGTECGLQIEGTTALQVGDVLELYTEELRKDTGEPST